MKQPLDDLIAEYADAAVLLTQMLEHGNALMRQARQNGETIRWQALRARQQDIYMQRSHVLQIKVHLETYYRKSNCFDG